MDPREESDPNKQIIQVLTLYGLPVQFQGTQYSAYRIGAIQSKTPGSHFHKVFSELNARKKKRSVEPSRSYLLLLLLKASHQDVYFRKSLTIN